MTEIADPMIRWDGVQKNIIILPNGNTVVVVPKTTTSFRVFESSDAVNYVVVGNYTVSAAFGRYSAIVNKDGTKIMLVYRCIDDSIKCRLITVSGWTAAVEEIAYPATANISLNLIDIDVSLNDAYVLAFPYASTGTDKTGYITRIRTSAGVWVAGNKVTLSATEGYKNHVASVTVAWYKTISATARRFTILVGWGSRDADKGVKWIHASVNEVDGSALSIQDLGYLPYGMLGYVTGSSFAMHPRRTRVIGLSDPNHQAMAISSGQMVTRKITSFLSTQTAGVFKITTPGINAAADIMSSTIVGFPNSGHTCRFDIGGKCISFAYDGDGNPSFCFYDMVSVESQSGSKTIDTSMVEGRVLAIAAPTTNPVVSLREGGNALNTARYRTSMSGYTSVDFLNKRHTISLQWLSNLWFTVAQHAIPIVTSVKPDSGAVITSSTPVVGGTAKTLPGFNRLPTYFYSDYTIAFDAGFTTGLYSLRGGLHQFGVYTAPDRSRGLPIDPAWDTDRGSINSTAYEDKWNGTPIPSGSRYIKTTIQDVYGNQSDAVATATPFSIAHSPMAQSITPPYSTTDPPAFPYVDVESVGYSLHYVGWKFSDAWPEDAQVAYQIQVFNSSNSVVYDTGKVISTNENASIRVPFANRNEILSFTVIVWDAYDQSATISGTSQYGSLLAYIGPLITSFVCTTLDGSGNINSNAPAFSYSITEGLYPTTSLDVVITQGSTIIASRSVPDPGASGLIVFPSSLSNASDYTFTAHAVDSNGLKGPYVLQGSTLWTPPATPTDVAVSLVNYNVENLSNIALSWTDTSRDTDWMGWNIYRQINQIDPNTGSVIFNGPVVLLYYSIEDQATMQYLDYTAPSGMQISYTVRQVANRFGSIIESASSAAVICLPVSDGYWLIDPMPEDINNSSFKLWSVTSESYTMKTESQITHIIGRGNHEDRGDDLGKEGSLGAKLRDSGSTTARQKKLRLEAVKSEARSLLLRNPFGDIYFVSVGDINVDRIAGTGISEFVDVTIPYTEVYE